VNLNGRIRSIEKILRRTAAQAGNGPLRFSRGGLVGGGNLDLNEFKKSYAAYRKATREDKP